MKKIQNITWDMRSKYCTRQEYERKLSMVGFSFAVIIILFTILTILK